MVNEILLIYYDFLWYVREKLEENGRTIKINEFRVQNYILDRA